MTTLKNFGMEMTIERKHYLNLIKSNIKLMILQSEDLISPKNLGTFNQSLGLALKIINIEYNNNIIKIEDELNEDNKS